jgi:hypothetical protein
LDQDEAYAGKELSDIRTKDTCYICDLPSDVEASHLILKNETYNNGILMLVATGVLVTGLFALRRIKAI